MSSDTMVQGVSALAGKYLTFHLAGEEYGLPIRTVQEIVAMVPITPVPRSPGHIRGVINLRGRVIPITDLRKRFALPPAEAPENVIIIVEVDGVVVGLAADQVSEVLQVPADQIEPPPAFGSDVETRYLLGLAKMDNRVRLLLDIAHVLGAEDLKAAAELTTA